MSVPPATAPDRPPGGGAGHRFGTGPLSRLTAAVHSVLVIGLLAALSMAPGVVLLAVLDRDRSNLPLVALAALPVAPGLAAAMAALRRPRDVLDLHPAAEFVAGYRATAVQALQLWTPLLALLAVIGVDLAHLDLAGVPPAWAGALALLGVVGLLWGLAALVLISAFSFRTRDVARLAGYFLVHTPGVTVGLAAVLVVAAGAVYLFSEAVLALGAVLVAAALLRVCAPMLAQTRREFTG